MFHRPKQIDVGKQTDGEKWKDDLGWPKEEVTVYGRRWVTL